MSKKIRWYFHIPGRSRVIKEIEIDDNATDKEIEERIKEEILNIEWGLCSKEGQDDR